MMKRLFFAIALLGSTTGLACAGPALDANGNFDLSAKRHHSHYGLICGATQMRHFGITDKRYRMARLWAEFEHVSPAPEVVVVQGRSGRASDGSPGAHVSRIVRTIDSCHAVVSDEKGTYERDICKRLIAYVNPHAGGAVPTIASRRRSGHRHRVRVSDTRTRYSGGPSVAPIY
jgi:hypothetical protein